MEPKFKKQSDIDNFQQLSHRVYQLKKLMHSKNIIFSTIRNGVLLFSIYVVLLLMLWFLPKGLFSYLVIVSMLGLLCAPMILMIGHESVHGNFTNNRILNELGKNVFYFLGTSPYFWELRHLYTHHEYNNVKKWDLNIEQNKMIRLDASQPYRPIHKYQVYYMPVLFMFYTLNWFFYRDFKDISLYDFESKKRWYQPFFQIVFLFLAKLWHLSFLAIIPLLLGVDWKWVVAGFFLFHFSASIMAILILISTNIGKEQMLLKASEKDVVPYSWTAHQIRTMINFSTNSSFLLHFLGGFNHRLTHHLFPNIPYTMLPQITPLVKEYCMDNDLPYDDSANLKGLLKAHFIRLKKYAVENPK